MKSNVTQKVCKQQFIQLLSSSYTWRQAIIYLCHQYDTHFLIVRMRQHYDRGLLYTEKSGSHPNIMLYTFETLRSYAIDHNNHDIILVYMWLMWETWTAQL